MMKEAGDHCCHIYIEPKSPQYDCGRDVMCFLEFFFLLLKIL